jgi:hypothetical protein
MSFQEAEHKRHVFCSLADNSSVDKPGHPLMELNEADLSISIFVEVLPDLFDIKAGHLQLNKELDHFIYTRQAIRASVKLA